ncbi:MAG: hypothetical protein H0U08_07495, partial [Actinobacteria bacterium]|nr:hypothetical protein [Actinomycetota bacterium]
MAIAVTFVASSAVQAATMRGNNLQNKLSGTVSADTIYGLGAADKLYGQGGADKLYGGRGNDLLVGGAGGDRLTGGAGADRLYGGPGSDVLVCGEGTDLAIANPADTVASDCERVHMHARTDARLLADHQHNGTDGHLVGTGDWGKIELVGQLEVTQTDGLVADVAAYGNYAYLANWGEPDCSGPETGGVNTPDSGAWVIDISDPANPVEVNFIAMPQDTRPGEGMQVTHIETAKFSGEILVMNAEACGKNYKGGFMLYDVTNPLKPVKLKEGFGDRTGSDAHQTHSAFVWQSGDNAYLVTQDEEDLADVDIYDITNPRSPRLISELNLNDYNVAQLDLNLGDSDLHDMTVKCMTDPDYTGV